MARALPAVLVVLLAAVASCAAVPWRRSPPPRVPRAQPSPFEPFQIPPSGAPLRAERGH